MVSILDIPTLPGRIRVRATFLIALCLLAAQCGDNSPTTPSEFLSGVWTGTFQDSASGPATARLTITQVGGSLTGTWSVDATSFAGAAPLGSIFGTVSGSNVSIFLRSSDPPTCLFDITATATGNTMAGTYTTFNCTVVLTGSISLTRMTIMLDDSQ